MTWRSVHGESRRLIGVIYVRGEMINLRKRGKLWIPTETICAYFQGLIKEFCDHFNFEGVMSGEFTRSPPVSYRSYGRLYAY